MDDSARNRFGLDWIGLGGVTTHFVDGRTDDCDDEETDDDETDDDEKETEWAWEGGDGGGNDDGSEDDDEWER